MDGAAERSRRKPIAFDREWTWGYWARMFSGYLRVCTLAMQSKQFGWAVRDTGLCVSFPMLYFRQFSDTLVGTNFMLMWLSKLQCIFSKRFLRSISCRASNYPLYNMTIGFIPSVFELNFRAGFPWGILDGGGAFLQRHPIYLSQTVRIAAFAPRVGLY